MRIGERFYEAFELRVDVDQAPADASFVVDLENARIPPVELAEATSEEALEAAQQLAAAATAVAQTAPLPPKVQEVRPPAATPLELAVLALLEQPATTTPDGAASIVETESEPETGTPGELGAAASEATTPGTIEPAKHARDGAGSKPAVATVAVREPAPLPEHPNPSHVHLVLDEGAERVVVTVAVRGNEVNVGLRASDDQVAAALARNAATLDHAMRARGLDLSGFTADRDLARDDRERQHADSHEPDSHDEPFRLEEIL